MIPNGDGWHHAAIKKLPVLLRRTTTKHHSDFYCVNCLHSFSTENKHESHKIGYETFCNVVMLSENIKTLKSIPKI